MGWMEELKELEKLLQIGAITQREFEREKAIIMAQNQKKASSNKQSKKRSPFGKKPSPPPPVQNSSVDQSRPAPPPPPRQRPSVGQSPPAPPPPLPRAPMGPPQANTPQQQFSQRQPSPQGRRPQVGQSPPAPPPPAPRSPARPSRSAVPPRQQPSGMQPNRVPDVGLEEEDLQTDFFPMSELKQPKTKTSKPKSSYVKLIVFSLVACLVIGVGAGVGIATLVNSNNKSAEKNDPPPSDAESQDEFVAEPSAPPSTETNFKNQMDVKELSLNSSRPTGRDEFASGAHIGQFPDLPPLDAVPKSAEVPANSRDVPLNNQVASNQSSAAMEADPCEAVEGYKEKNKPPPERLSPINKNPKKCYAKAYSCAPDEDGNYPTYEIQGTTIGGQKNFDNNFWVMSYCTPQRRGFGKSPEAIFRVELPAHSSVEILLTPLCDADLVPFSFPWNNKTCPDADQRIGTSCDLWSPSATSTRPREHKVYTTKNPQTFFIGVEGLDGDQGNFDLTLQCDGP